MIWQDVKHKLYPDSHYAYSCFLGVGWFATFVFTLVVMIYVVFGYYLNIPNYFPPVAMILLCIISFVAL